MSKNSMAIFIALFMAMFMALLFRGAVFGLDPERAVTQYVIDTWNSDSGLPTNSIVKVLQTSDGYLWLGTEEGLLRFDGVTFSIFDESNTPEITDNFIYCLCEDSRKNLWIGLRNGKLLRYKNGIFKQYTGNDGFLSNAVNCITEGPDGAIWIGTEVLYKFQDNKFTSFTIDNGLPGKNVKTIHKDSKGNLWIGTSNGLSRFKNNKFSTYHIKKDESENSIRTIFEELKNGNIWLGTAKGLFLMRNGAGVITSSPFNAAFPNLKISTIFEDNDKNIWIGTYTQGLFRYKPTDGTFANLSKAEGLADDIARTVIEDREGSIWIGTPYGGLCRLRDGKFKTFGTREGLADEVAFAIVEDSKHYLWIGTNKGLTRLRDGREPVNFGVSEGLSNASVNTIYQDQDDSIWVCTENGLNQLQNSFSKTVKIKQYIHDDYVLSFAGDSAENLWAGTRSGLFKKEKNSADWQKIYFEISNGEKEYFKHVSLIFEDKNKNIWFSAHVYPRGLVKFSDGTFTLYNEKKGLSSISLQCVYEDKDDVLWFGSVNGLFRFKNEKFTHFTMKDGLFNNNIYQILEDNQGNFWISCNKGFFTVSKKNLNDYAEGKKTAIFCTVYNKDDGMRSQECNGGFQTAGCKSSDGKLWFPTNKGVVIVDPEKIVINKLPPPVLIEQVLLDGVPVPQDEEIKIKPGVKRIEFRYTGLSFRVPKRVKFKYRLEGYNNDWMDAGNMRIATYTNLNAGAYRFQVTACNDDGVWNEQGAAVVFSVIPYWYNTWLFRILALMAFALLSYLVINFINRYLNLVNFWKKQKYVGKFKLLDKLGSGGMGTVYKAENTLERSEKVAIKVLREELFEDEKNRKRFKQEAAIIDQLDHPNIIKIYERGQSHHTMYIAMELLEGKTLTKKIAAEGRLDLFESLHIMTQVTEAVAKIHSKNIIHRDMKPDNVMLIQRNNDPHFVKLLDFGLAKMEHQTRLTQTGMVIGTINYMAPEQIAGTPISGATDIYSIGVMFYEMLTGKKPFDGETSIDIMKEIIEKLPVEPLKYRPDMPLELSNLILRMMDKKKVERPASEEVLQSLLGIYSRMKDEMISASGGQDPF